jgi:hypothetical protein
MITIYCTKKLLERSGLPAESLVLEPTTALGNWHADYLFVGRSRFLMFVSDNSRLAVVTSAREARLLAGHLTQGLAALLDRLGVSQEWIQAEVREMAEVHIAPTRSRSVLGTMTVYKYQMEGMLEEPGEMNPLEISLALSEILAGPLQYRQPREVALDLLKQRYSIP